MQKITPFLWFDNQAEEAVNFYASIFKNSRILITTRYGEEGAQASGRPEGTVMTMAFQLDGQDFLALNGGPHFKFTEAISFVVHCESQEEIDYYWEKLSAGGDAKAQQCGWLKDKYGLSWQIVPSALGELLNDPDPAKSRRVMADGRVRLQGYPPQRGLADGSLFPANSAGPSEAGERQSPFSLGYDESEQ